MHESMSFSQSNDYQMPSVDQHFVVLGFALHQSHRNRTVGKMC